MRVMRVSCPPCFPHHNNDGTVTEDDDDWDGHRRLDYGRALLLLKNGGDFCSVPAIGTSKDSVVLNAS